MWSQESIAITASSLVVAVVCSPDGAHRSAVAARRVAAIRGGSRDLHVLDAQIWAQVSRVPGHLRPAFLSTPSFLILKSLLSFSPRQYGPDRFIVADATPISQR